ncbi:MAG: hypothetical protein WCI73_12775, partial [Phycisphaerae bacterium]
PDTVYAGTEGGLHKSTDAGEHWQLLPKTGPKELRLTAERNVSVRSVAVDPTDSNILYAASPAGKVYKSSDGGQTWALSYEKQTDPADTNALYLQFGQVNGAYFAGAWLNLSFPDAAKSEDCTGIGFSFRGNHSKPTDRYFVTLKTATGLGYESKNLTDLFSTDQWQDVVLKAEDFTLDAASVKRFPDAAKQPIKWSDVNRLDFACNGPMKPSAIGRFKQFFFAFNGPDAGKPVLKTVRDFTVDKILQSYGDIRVSPAPPAKTIYSVAVALKDPSLVVAATEESGLVLSEDAGKTWRQLSVPKAATSAVFADTDPNLMYAAFPKEGVWKSTDTGKTWARSSEGIAADADVREVAVSPVNPRDVYVIGGGPAYSSNDGGNTWKKAPPFSVDLEGNPPRHYGGTNPTSNMGRSKNIAINPQNPKELYIAQDWRSPWSGDAGRTWHERVRGSDISCNTDIRFSKGHTYATAMDEGALVSEDNGKTWRQLWPLQYIAAESGHSWRINVNTVDGVDRIVTAFSPWNNSPKINLVILSDDGGKTHQVTKAGLPDYLPKKNTMWENGFIRALATDPANPKILYAGIDGDPEPGKTGGGIFKSEDGGHNWKQLPNQPGSRRMFYGLAVDPTDSKRIFWGACATNGGLWMTEDGGDTWKNVFSHETWVWNVLVANDGRVYASGANLWRSADHGKTWTQLTTFKGRTMQGIEADPRDAKTFWVAAYGKDRVTESGIYKTTDDGATWTDITGDSPNRQPQVLRFNPETNELWSGCVGLYKIKQ